MVQQLENLHNRWLAVQVRARWEINVARILRERGYDEFLPLWEQKRHWSDRNKIVPVPLFSGYLFLRFDSTNRQPIVSLPGVIGFVGMGSTPLPIDDSEIEALKITTRAAVKYAPCSFLDVGHLAEIRSGPLCGLRGNIVRFKNKHRLILSITLLRKSVYVELDAYEIAAVDTMHRSCA